MPARVRFQTEYNSSFKAPSIEVLKTARSPILKPKPAFETISGDEKQTFQAGLKSSDAHIAREPPLQHKKILKNVHNPNFEKEAAKINNVIGREGKEPSNKEPNPILKYANEVENAKKNDEFQVNKAVTNEELSPGSKTIAGSESENLRYLALEPPMQRKRRSSYNFNHNILRTNTIEYLNGARADENRKLNGENGNLIEDEQLQGSENVRKKLHFDQPASKSEAVDRILPVKTSEAMAQSEIERRSKSTNKEDEDNDKRSRKKKLSPAKEQRKKDLREMKKRQNERVERALQIKAGMQSVEPPLYSHPMTSEYRKQFVWKEPIKRELRYVIPVSDISQDEERKVDEDKKIRKYKPFRTEYQLQFKNYPLSKESQPESKNTPVVSENQQFEEKVYSPEKRSLHHSKNVQPIFFPHGSQSSSETEYKAKYVSPSNAQQKKGARLESRAPINAEEVTKGDTTDWFKEVLKLRQKAQSYKERARETHYPTVFLASLEDDDGCSSEDSFAQTVEGNGKLPKDGLTKGVVSNVPVNGTDQQNGHEPEDGESDNNNAPRANSKKRDGGSKDCASNGDAEEHHAVPAKAAKAKSTNLKNKVLSAKSDKNNHDSKKKKRNGGMVKLDEETQTSFEPEMEARVNSPTSTLSSDTDESVMNVLKGRLDTARLKNTTDHRRHNLDRTTPARGGTIAAPSSKLSSEISAPVHEFRTMGQDIQLKEHPTREKQHLNRDDAWKWSSGDQVRGSHANVVRETKPVSMVTQKTYHRDKYEDKENDGDLLLTDLEEREEKSNVPVSKHLTRTLAPPRAFVQPSEHEQRASEKSRLDDSDLLSDTSMSARDSVISDVLERSRRRRDGFW